MWEAAGAPGQSATYHYPDHQRMSLKQELKSKGRDWKCPVSECYKWPWDICKCQGVWQYSKTRTHCDAFLSYEMLFWKYCSWTARLKKINKICGGQIYLYLQEALCSFWIPDCFWLSMAPYFRSAVQGLQGAFGHNKTQVSIFFSSALTSQMLHTVNHFIP